MSDTDNEMQVPKVPSHKERQVQKMLATRMASRAFDKFYKDNSVRSVSILGACLTLSLVMNFYQATRPVVHDYIYADRNGRIITLYSMDQPNKSDAEVATWATKAVTDTLSFNYVDYRERLQNADNLYFSPGGWDAFQKQLNTIHLIQLITDNNFIISTRATAAPILESSGIMNGAYTWNYKIPVIMSLHGTRSTGNGTLAPDTESRNMVVNVIIVRQPEIASEQGISIAQIFFSSEG